MMFVVDRVIGVGLLCQLNTFYSFIYGSYRLFWFEKRTNPSSEGEMKNEDGKNTRMKNANLTT